ncbi:polyprenyl synthetase family protein [Micrococcus sp. EYE_162]|uniref:polyprenyl synthetase family protein n=1 Tax=unclassified Micrococcus TaxID=2620948 RepID=UPI002006BEB0|nr:MULTISPECIES: polyprenyl synthetase family protein [unclassified Micrococcus]MCK6096022.1 polyprenyl synthetase family protein [Micrococcus sp. EYE_212]MCK6172113.1 polyprenyl synthetase family protein [Micrococcus sp. EYE_162]
MPDAATLSPSPADAPSPDTHSAAVAARLEEILDRRRDDARAIHPGAVPVVDAIARLTSGGKRLRAVLCWLGWRAAGADPADPRIVTAGAAFELFQAAALIHDDILDRSDTRRGMPSVHRHFEATHRAAGWRHEAEHFGVSAAILAGDVCLALSDEAFAESIAGSPRAGRARAEMERMRFEVMAGQYLDVLAEMTPPDPDPAEAVRSAATVVEFKSARYSAVHPLALGGLLAGAEDALLEAFAAVSLPFGLAFQYHDDLLGVFGDPALTGKPSGDDLREGKRTVLIARAAALLDPAEAEALDADLGDADLADDRVAHWQRRLEECGARAAVAADVDRLSAEATAGVAAWEGLGVEDAVCSAVSGLIDAFTRRSA